VCAHVCVEVCALYIYIYIYESSLSRIFEVLSLNHIMPGERFASLCYTVLLLGAC